MAVRYAVVNGNWSDPATWDGGAALPDTVDDVYLNGQTVTIDQDISINSIRRTSLASPVVVNGGTIQVLSVAGTRTLTFATDLIPNTTADGHILWLNHPSGTVVINAPAVRGENTNDRAIRIEGLGALIINADVVGGYGSSASALEVASATTLTINGDVYTKTGSGVCMAVTAPATVTINGSVTSTGATCISSSVSVALTIHGDVVTTGGNYAVYVNHASAVVDIDGACTASNSACGLYSIAQITRIRGPLYAAPNNRQPVISQYLQVYADTPTSWTMNDSSAGTAGGTPVRLSNSLEGVPAQSDVRAGVTFGAGGSLTGSLAMPAPGSVASGVPVDNTVGTATLKLDELAAVTGAQISSALTS